MSETNPIRRDQLAAMFDGMRAQAPWNVDNPLLWGYFFSARNPAALEAVSRDLTSDGYRHVALRLGQQNGNATGECVLHVERVEQHSVDSLDERNSELSALASKHLARYDGMDVGPAR